MKIQMPERGEIRVNGVRDHFEEDLGYLLALHWTMVHYHAVLTLHGTQALHRAVAKIERAYIKERAAFVKKWGRRCP